MKKVLLTSVALLSIFGAATVLADQSFVNTDTPATFGSDSSLGKPALDNPYKGISTEEKMTRPYGYTGREPKTENNGATRGTQSDTSTPFTFDSLYKGVEGASTEKAAAPTMGQTSAAAEKAAEKAAPKAAAKALPNTGAVK